MKSRNVIIAALVLVAVGLGAWLMFTQRQDPSAARRASGQEQKPTTTSVTATASTPALAPITATGAGAEDAAPTALAAPSGNPALAGLPRYSGPARERHRADALREALTTLYAGKLAAQAEEPAQMPQPEGEGNQADKPLGKYVDRVLQEQFLPLAGSCYEELLSHHPKLAGNVSLDFTIMGDPSVGGVVVDVAFGKGTTLKDAGFQTCMSESMYAVVFDAPPEGHPTTTVTQSFELAP